MQFSTYELTKDYTDLISQQPCLVFGIYQIRDGAEMITQNVVCRICFQPFQKYVGTESKIICVF